MPEPPRAPQRTTPSRVSNTRRVRCTRESEAKGLPRKGGSRKRGGAARDTACLAERRTRHKVSASGGEAHAHRLAVRQAGEHADAIIFFPPCERRKKGGGGTKQM